MKYIIVYHPDSDKEFIESEFLTFDDVVNRLRGFVEAHYFGGLSFLCDEEGKCKGLLPSLYIRKMNLTFVGDIYIGRFTNKGLEGVDIDEFLNVEKTLGLASTF